MKDYGNRCNSASGLCETTEVMVLLFTGEVKEAAPPEMRQSLRGKVSPAVFDNTGEIKRLPRETWGFHGCDNPEKSQNMQRGFGPEGSNELGFIGGVLTAG